MSRSCTVFVPATVAIAFTADRGWHALAAPPAWWVEEMQDDLRHGHGGPLMEGDRVASDPGLLAALRGRMGSCRPGPRPCRRRHVHASSSRAGAA